MFVTNKFLANVFADEVRACSRLVDLRLPDGAFVQR